MTTGRINQITLCRLRETVLLAPRAATRQCTPLFCDKNSEEHQHGAFSNTRSEKLVSELHMMRCRRSASSQPVLPMQKFRPLFNIRTVARRLDIKVPRPRYRGSGVPTQYNVTRVVRRVFFRDTLEKRHEVPSKPTS